MNSSAIAAMQPAGSATALLATGGAASATLNGSALNGKIPPGSSDGLFGDGFRQRFEASVGMTRPDGAGEENATARAVQEIGSGTTLPRSGAILAGSDTTSIAQGIVDSTARPGMPDTDGLEQVTSPAQITSPDQIPSLGVRATEVNAVGTSEAPKTPLVAPGATVHGAVQLRTSVGGQAQRDSAFTRKVTTQATAWGGDAIGTPKVTLTLPLQPRTQPSSVVEMEVSKTTSQGDSEQSGPAAQVRAISLGSSLPVSLNSADNSPADPAHAAAEVLVYAVASTLKEDLSKTTSLKPGFAQPAAVLKKEAPSKGNLVAVAPSGDVGQSSPVFVAQAHVFLVQLSPVPVSVSTPQSSPEPVSYRVPPAIPQIETEPLLEMQAAASSPLSPGQHPSDTSLNVRSGPGEFVRVPASLSKVAESEQTKKVGGSYGSAPIIAMSPTAVLGGTTSNQTMDTTALQATSPSAFVLAQSGGAHNFAVRPAVANRGVSQNPTVLPAASGQLPTWDASQTRTASVPLSQLDISEQIDSLSIDVRVDGNAGNNNSVSWKLDPTPVQPADRSLKARQATDATPVMSFTKQVTTTGTGFEEIDTRFHPAAGTEIDPDIPATVQATLSGAAESIVPASSQRKGPLANVLPTVSPASGIVHTQPFQATATVAAGIPSTVADADPLPSSKGPGEIQATVKGRVLQGQADGSQSGVNVAIAPPLQGEVRGETKSAPGPELRTFSSGITEAAGNAGRVEGLDHTTLVSTPKVLEVGVASGTNGWLKVRAELDGAGGVAASVVTSTVGAADALHKELPSLSAYLRDESVGLTSLVVHSAGGGGLLQDATAGFSAGSSGPGSQSGREAPHYPGESPVQQQILSDGVDRSVSGISSGTAFTPGTTGTQHDDASGRRLNVVA